MGPSSPSTDRFAASVKDPAQRLAQSSALASATDFLTRRARSRWMSLRWEAEARWRACAAFFARVCWACASRPSSVGKCGNALFALASQVRVGQVWPWPRRCGRRGGKPRGPGECCCAQCSSSCVVRSYLVCLPVWRVCWPAAPTTRRFQPASHRRPRRPRPIVIRAKKPWHRRCSLPLRWSASLAASLTRRG